MGLNDFKPDVLAILERIRNEKRPSFFSIENVPLFILPGVFSPQYFPESIFFARELSKLVKKKTLFEVGTGTGIISLFCAQNGSNVVATDINSTAVKNAQLNFGLHHIGGSVRKGVLYSPLKKGEKFDFIFWNHPFNNTPRKLNDVLLKSIFDTNYVSLRKYVKGASQHLKKGGRLLLGTADFADWKTMRSIAKENGYSLKILKRRNFKIMKGKNFSARFFIIEFIKNS